MSAELLERYRCDRNRRDYERLVEMHGPLVASVCRRLLRDPNDVDDVVQATFLKLAGSLDTVSGSLAGWLVATARAPASISSAGSSASATADADSGSSGRNRSSTWRSACGCTMRCWRSSRRRGRC